MAKGWSKKITTDSTYPPEGLYTKSAGEIARVMARKSVSPKGLGSAIMMVTMYINRAGRNLKPERRAALERAKRMLHSRPECGADSRPAAQPMPHAAIRPPSETPANRYAGTLATVAAGRTATVARLRALATRVEQLPLDAAAEVLVLLEPALAALEQHAALALERALTGAQ
jgi:hypothetical protein